MRELPLQLVADGAPVLIASATPVPYCGDPCATCGALTCVETGAGRKCVGCGAVSPVPAISPALVRRLPGPRFGVLLFAPFDGPPLDDIGVILCAILVLCACAFLGLLARP